MQNLIMRSVINVYSEGSSRLETDLDPSDLEKAKQELIDRGYGVIISVEKEKTYFVVFSKNENNLKKELK